MLSYVPALRRVPVGGSGGPRGDGLCVPLREDPLLAAAVVALEEQEKTKKKGPTDTETWEEKNYEHQLCVFLLLCLCFKKFWRNERKHSRKQGKKSEVEVGGD